MSFRSRLCKLFSFFRQHAQETAEGAYKLLGICSSETSLFEPLRKNMRGRWVRPPWGDMEYSVFLAVVPELHGVPRTGVSHGSHCSPNKPLGATLRGFRVINYDKKPLSPEPVPSSEKYTALSYL
ncbi:hypothetical protein HZ326_25365 [Fusarium oxysporum f. sp. albedinis]|nr:hypothetical protein HZ326_25365 [Fusarium oxysporum f. sp. albedinis]